MPYKLLFEVRSLGFRDAGNSKRPFARSFMDSPKGFCKGPGPWSCQAAADPPTGGDKTDLDLQGR